MSISPGSAWANDAIALRLAERLKIALSNQATASEVYFDEQTLSTVDMTLDRAGLEQILRDRGLFDQLDGAMQQVLQQAKRQGIEAKEIEAVLLVGGSSRMPAVQTWIHQYFPQERVALDRPLEAIALGALQLGQGLELKDFLYHSYGIRYWNRRDQCHSWHPIIPQGQPYPMERPVELLLGASSENQPSIELIMGELGEESGGMEIFFEGDRLITRTTGGKATVQPLNDRDGARSIAKLDPPGFPGSDRIKVLFRVDAERQLRISVEDLLTHATLLDEVAIAQLS